MTQKVNFVFTFIWAVTLTLHTGKGLPESERPAPGSEQDACAQLVSRFQSEDKSWKLECLKRDEKFDMHFTAAVRVRSMSSCTPN